MLLFSNLRLRGGGGREATFVSVGVKTENESVLYNQVNLWVVHALYDGGSLQIGMRASEGFLIALPQQVSFVLKLLITAAGAEGKCRERRGRSVWALIRCSAAASAEGRRGKILHQTPTETPVPCSLSWCLSSPRKPSSSSTTARCKAGVTLKCDVALQPVVQTTKT